MFKQKSEPTAATAPTDAVQQARTRARQRLIGAIVLLAIGIIGFPLVFETQPRPIPVDIPIEIPRRDALPPLVAPPPTTASTPAAVAASASRPRTAQAAPAAPRNDTEVITESRSEAGREVGESRPAASAAPRTAAASAPARSASPAAPKVAAASSAAAAEPHRVAAAPSAAAPAKPAPSASSDGDRARALLEGRPVAAPAASAEAPRFVVQVGAFADAEAARETRQKAEKLGFKTYTQVAQTAAGSRVRVRLGPFASRADADAALAKASAAGLTAVVLTL